MTFTGYGTIVLWLLAMLAFIVSLRLQTVGLKLLNRRVEQKSTHAIPSLLVKNVSRLLPIGVSIYIASLVPELSTLWENVIATLFMAIMLYQIFRWFGVVFDYYDAPEKMAMERVCRQQDNRWVCTLEKQ